jgi:hypothetical protein
MLLASLKAQTHLKKTIFIFYMLSIVTVSKNNKYEPIMLHVKSSIIGLITFAIVRLPDTCIKCTVLGNSKGLNLYHFATHKFFFTAF